MKITRIDAFLLSYPFPKPLLLPYHGGLRKIVKRDAMLIRVETDKGLIGYAPGAGSEEAKRQIAGIIAPFCQGHTLADPDALRIQFFSGPGKDNAELAKVYCNVEVAFYDLTGQALGLPVSELIGGRVRDKIALYASAGMYMDPAGYAREAAQAKEMGFQAYKMRPALGPDKDIETVAKMREATGFGFGLMVDAHSWWRMGDKSYTAETVERVAGAMSAHDITWLEEPLPPADHEAYRALRAKDIVPIATGEHEPDEGGYLDLIHNECAEYIQMDVVCQGGYALGRRIFSAIEQANLRFAFHSWGTALEVVAAAHLGVCWPANVVEWLEYPVYSDGRYQFMYEWPLANEILTEPLEIVKGDLAVPRAPGLGVKVNEAVIEKYPWIPGPWSYFSIDSPRQTWAVTADHSVPFVEVASPDTPRKTDVART